MRFKKKYVSGGEGEENEDSWIPLLNTDKDFTENKSEVYVKSHSKLYGYIHDILSLRSETKMSKFAKDAENKDSPKNSCSKREDSMVQRIRSVLYKNWKSSEFDMDEKDNYENFIEYLDTVKSKEDEEEVETKGFRKIQKSKKFFNKGSGYKKSYWRRNVTNSFLNEKNKKSRILFDTAEKIENSENSMLGGCEKRESFDDSFNGSQIIRREVIGDDKANVNYDKDQNIAGNLDKCVQTDLYWNDVSTIEKLNNISDKIINKEKNYSNIVEGSKIPINEILNNNSVSINTQKIKDDIKKIPIIAPPPIPPPPPPTAFGNKSKALARCLCNKLAEDAQNDTGLRRYQKVIDTFQELRIADLQIEPNNNGSTRFKRIPTACDKEANSFITELASRSRYTKQVISNICHYKNDIEALCVKISAANFLSMEKLSKFVYDTDCFLDRLVDETAVLKAFEWPNRYYAFREANALYLELAGMKSGFKKWVLKKDSENSTTELSQMQKFSCEVIRKVDGILSQQRQLETKFKSNGIPFDFKMVAEVKQASIDMMTHYLKTLIHIIVPKISVFNMSPKAKQENFSIIREALKFSFKIHGFAGGFTSECFKHFERVVVLKEAIFS